MATFLQDMYDPDRLSDVELAGLLDELRVQQTAGPREQVQLWGERERTELVCVKKGGERGERKRAKIWKMKGRLEGYILKTERKG